MVDNVKSEIELYEPMRKWMQTYLENRYKRSSVITIDSHARNLDAILEECGAIKYYPHTRGIDIQIDVLGLVSMGNKTHIAFIEAKKTKLNLHDLGQLWAYCKLCDPLEAFLLSSAGLGALDKILNNLGRNDLLDFGDGRTIKKMQVGKWDVASSGVDFKTLIPKL